MLNIRLHFHRLNNCGLIMKAIRTELLPLEVIAAGFLPLKPPNRMLPSYMQFPYPDVPSIGQAISVPLWFMQNTNPSGTNGSINETTKGSSHCSAPFFIFLFFFTVSNPSWWNTLKCSLVAWLLGANKSSDRGWCPYSSYSSVFSL